MSTLLERPQPISTLADLVRELGDVPLWRISRRPAPGTAREADVPTASGSGKQLFELVDGTLVEKPMGAFESRVALVLSFFLEGWHGSGEAGFALGEAGLLRIRPGLIRIPDVSFICWSQLPAPEIPGAPVPDLHPDLAVEVLSAGNTEAEMQRKVREYFAAGAALVWLVEPRGHTVRVFRAPGECETVGPEGELTGDPVLPGFRLSVREWFDRVGPVGGA